MSENPYSSPKDASGSPFSGQGVPLSFDDVAPICTASGWLKLLGIFNIIVGVIYCITIIGLIIGWLPLWIGISLNRAANALKAGYEQSNRALIQEGMNSLALVFKIVGVLVIIYLALFALYLLIVFVAVIVGVLSQAAS